MGEKRILKSTDYDRLKKMINGTDEDMNLVISLIDTCNIEESFRYILCLIPQRWNTKYVMSSQLMVSPRLYAYVYDLVGGAKGIPTEVTLDFMMELWALHSEKHNLQPSARVIKSICTEYRVNENSTDDRKVRGMFDRGAIDAQKRAAAAQAKASKAKSIKKFGNDPFKNLK